MRERMKNFLYRITSRVCGRGVTSSENRSVNLRHGISVRAHAAMLLLGICLLVGGSLVIVHAADDDTPSLTFTNERDDKITLTVTKKVTTPSTAAIPTEDAFTFRILCDGTVDNKLTYTLTDADGEEWVKAYAYVQTKDDDGNILSETIKYAVYDSNGKVAFTADSQAAAELIKASDLSGTSYSTVPLTPDSSGRFTLKKDWTAVFSGNNMIVGKKYTVTEVTNGKDANGKEIVTFETADGESYYYQPAAAEIPVTIAGNSAENKAAFSNTYYPPTTDTKKGTLTVSKKIFGADGYDLPTTPTFTFCLVLDGKVCRNQDYNVYDVDDKLVSKGATDTNGIFTLTGGQYVTFEEISTNLDYTVYEYAKPGWWCVDGKPGSESVSIASDGTVTEAKAGSTGATTLTYAEKRSGVTASATLEEFQNRCGSFVVKKLLTDGQTAEDMEFRFILKDKDGNAWANQSYYVYGADGRLAATDLQKTAADGSFTLAANQSALFIGIAQGTAYTVEEPDTPLYECAQPSDGKYTGTVGDTVESLPFTNNILDNYGLYISKLVMNEPAAQVAAAAAEDEDVQESDANTADGESEESGTSANDGNSQESDANAADGESQESGSDTEKVYTSFAELPTVNADGKRLYTFRLVKVTTDASGAETETEVANKTYGEKAAEDSKAAAVTFYTVAVTDEKGTKTNIHIFQMTADDYVHFRNLDDGEYRLYEYAVDKSVIATATYTAADSNESDSDMAFGAQSIDANTGMRDMKLAKTFTVDADQVQELTVTNEYTEAMFRISKTILDYNGNPLGVTGAGSGNSQIEAGGDVSQRFVYRIDRYKDKSTWSKGGTPLSTTYTDLNCDASGTGSVLVQGSGDGWYVITEVTDWSATTYNFNTCGYSGLRESEAVDVVKNSEGEAPAVVQYSTDLGYVAFELEDVYDVCELPTAKFTNKESPYAYRTGSAYAENQISAGE